LGRSYAYGIPDADSDLDLYVIMKDDAPFDAIEAEQKIWRTMHRHKPMSADILVMKKSRLQYRCGALTLEHEVANKGIVIYGGAGGTVWRMNNPGQGPPGFACHH
jgi:predicted nucleotidyltransferase